MGGIIRDKRRVQCVDLPERLLIFGGNLQAGGLHFLQTGELNQTQGRLNIKHVVLEAGFCNIVFPGAAFCIAVPGVVAHPLAGEDPCACVDLVVVGDQHTAVARAEVFRGIKTVGGRALQFVADQTALVAAPQRMRRIFAHKQAVLVRNRIDAVQVADLAAVMDGNDGLCPGGNLFLDLIRVDAAGSVVDVGKYRRCSCMDDGACGGGERHRGGDDLVAGANPLCKQRNVKRRRAGVHGDSVFCAEITGEFLLKPVGAGAFGDPAGFQRFHDLVDFCVGDVRYIIGDKVVPSLKITHESIASFSHKIWACCLTCSPLWIFLQIYGEPQRHTAYFTPNIRFY